MKKLSTKTNVVAPGGPNDFGLLKDDPGDGSGTPVDVELVHDSMIFIERLMEQSGITINGFADDNVNGYQVYEAFRKLTRPYKVYWGTLKQVGTGGPTFTEMGFNDLGNIVWTRLNPGDYLGTLAGAFVLTETWLYIRPDAHDFADVQIRLERTGVNTVTLKTTVGGVFSDSLLDNHEIEIRIAE